MIKHALYTLIKKELMAPVARDHGDTAQRLTDRIVAEFDLMRRGAAHAILETVRGFLGKELYWGKQAEAQLHEASKIENDRKAGA
jgi:hypothetical protein